MKCPTPQCEEEIDPNDLRALLPPELFDKYSKDSYMANNNVFTCPNCQYNLLCEEQQEETFQCPMCQTLYIYIYIYISSYCTFCWEPAHGVEKCPFLEDMQEELPPENHPADSKLVDIRRSFEEQKEREKRPKNNRHQQRKNTHINKYRDERYMDKGKAHYFQLAKDEYEEEKQMLAKKLNSSRNPYFFNKK